MKYSVVHQTAKSVVQNLTTEMHRNTTCDHFPVVPIYSTHLVLPRKYFSKQSTPLATGISRRFNGCSANPFHGNGMMYHGKIQHAANYSNSAGNYTGGVTLQKIKVINYLLLATLSPIITALLKWMCNSITKNNATTFLHFRFLAAVFASLARHSDVSARSKHSGCICT